MPTGREPYGDGAVVVVRPCGAGVSTSDQRYHWSKVVKAASYLAVFDGQGHLHPKGAKGQEHDVKRLMKPQCQGPEVSQLGRVW